MTFSMGKAALISTLAIACTGPEPTCRSAWILIHPYIFATDYNHKAQIQEW